MITKEVIKETRKADYSLNDLKNELLTVRKSDILIDLREVGEVIRASMEDVRTFRESVSINRFCEIDYLVSPQQASDFMMWQVIHRDNHIARERVQSILAQALTR